ncbi:MAG: hypothetical protein K6A43_12965 [Treponema sp.]|nr:hypothetical protein [Treponema sp.]
MNKFIGMYAVFAITAIFFVCCKQNVDDDSMKFDDSEVPETVLSVTLSDGEWNFINSQQCKYTIKQNGLEYQIEALEERSIDFIVEGNKLKATYGKLSLSYKLLNGNVNDLQNYSGYGDVEVILRKLNKDGIYTLTEEYPDQELKSMSDTSVDKFCANGNDADEIKTNSKRTKYKLVWKFSTYKNSGTAIGTQTIYLIKK